LLVVVEVNFGGKELPVDVGDNDEEEEELWVVEIEGDGKRFEWVDWNSKSGFSLNFIPEGLLWIEKGLMGESASVGLSSLTIFELVWAGKGKRAGKERFF